MSPKIIPLRNHVNEVARSLGAENTLLYQKVSSERAAVPSLDNRTTPRDMALMLEKIAEAPQKVRYRVEVTETSKGDVQDEVGVVTYDNGGMCGVDLTAGRDYRIYATGDSSDGKVETNLCSGTRQVDRRPGCRNQ